MVACAAVGLSAGQPAARPTADAAFASFFQAADQKQAAAGVGEIVASGVSFEEAFRRLKQGRPYSREVPRGAVQRSHRTETGEYFYSLDIPETYDPTRKYQVRLQLHGGVGRIEENVPPKSSTTGRLMGAEQIYVMPYAWRDAPWWSGRQIENLRSIIDAVKRTYNVDENRIVLAGVSDGGTGAYFVAMRDTTPFASFLPLNGFIMVLKNETSEDEGDLSPNNLLNKPLFVVNGGRDPIYPTSTVDPYIEHLKGAGVVLDYRPQPNAAHDTSWWPDVKESFEQFVADHPRRPLPDTLTWESGPPNIPSRSHWLVIERLAPARSAAAALADANRMTIRPAADFGIRASGTRVNRVVKGSNAEQIGMRAGDRVVALNNQPTAPGTDVADVLRNFPAGRPIIVTVMRGNESIRLTGRYAPTVLPGEAEAMFPRQRDSGRVDLTRVDNRITATTSGVAAFTLLLSPDQFDFNRPVSVVVNGQTTFAGTVNKNLGTLLKWAALDNDRTMLFAAELPIQVAQ